MSIDKIGVHNEHDKARVKFEPDETRTHWNIGMLL